MLRANAFALQNILNQQRKRNAMPISTKDLQAALPDLESTQCCEGLKKTVTVHRDSWGIPHIKAESEADLFFAQGFATAQDRLWHMDFDRHQALGRWSEWAGPAGLDRDRLLRAAGMGRTAKLDYETSSLQARAMLDAYAAGVNAFLATTTALPVEYQLLGQSSRGRGKAGTASPCTRCATACSAPLNPSSGAPVWPK